MKLNLGEGHFPIPGYVGVDRKAGQEIYPLDDYPDGSVEKIRASHVLEHFSHQETQAVINDWVRALEPGGVLRIAVPDFARIVQWYERGEPNEPLQSYLLGGQIDEDDYHKSVFDAALLTRRLEIAGLVDIKPWVSEIEDNASWEVSLNLQGTKPTEDGRQKTGWPASQAANRYSQYGEDGILSAIFGKIGIENQYCVDVGAADGLLFSNVRQFIEQGWSGLLIESDPERFLKLSQDSGGQFGQGQVRCFNYMVEPHGLNSLDSLLEKAGAPKEFDLLSIDVDGQDYYIWNSLLRFSPRVVVVEYDPETDPMFIPPLGGVGQAGWHAMAYVAAARGYVSVAKTHTNLICLRRDIIAAKGMEVVMQDEPGYEPVVDAPPSPIAIAIRLDPGEPLQSRALDITGASLLEQTDTVDEKPIKIVAVITVPRLGFNANWHSTVRALLALQIPVELVEGVFWGQCLTRGIEKTIAQDADVILTIDYDTIFDVQHVVKLCQLLGDHPEYSAIVPVQTKRECNQMLFAMNGSRDFSQALTPIAAGHFGLTVFDAKAFAKLPKPWFIDVPNADGEWGEGRIDCDMQFWKQFIDAGLKVGLANAVRIGHLELVISWPSKDFKKVSQTISDYRTNGQPIDCGGDLGIQLEQ